MEAGDHLEMAEIDGCHGITMLQRSCSEIKPIRSAPPR